MTSDYYEKLETARDYLIEYPADSQEFEAAAQHLSWAIDNADLKGLRKIEELGREILDARGNDPKALRVLTEVLL